MIVHAHIIRSIQSLVPFSIIVNIPFTNVNISDLPSPTLCVHNTHALRCETGRLHTLFPKQVQESEYHTLIQCSTFDHIRPCFPHIFDQAQSLH